MSARRKSTVNINVASRTEQSYEDSSALELERLEQETTLVLQEIDHNLSRANSIINNKIFPVLQRYASATGSAWQNTEFWKQFMEEAAEVEINAVEEQVTSPHKEKASTDVEESSSKTNDNIRKKSGPEKQLETSTPQQQPSVATFSSSHGAGSPRRNTESLSSQHRLRVSPRKKTPTRTQNHEHRQSILQNFLNSSPTLPEPPVLLSEIGRVNTTGSSSASRPRPNDRNFSSSSSINLELGKLSPIGLPSLAMTPSGVQSKPAQENSTQRFPSAPTFESSGRASGKRTSYASPIRRSPIHLRQQFQDDSDLPMPQSMSAREPNNDDSDEVSLPKLQTINLASIENENHRKAEFNSPKRKKARSGIIVAENVITTHMHERQEEEQEGGAEDDGDSDDDELDNVFLDKSKTSKSNNSTLYHSLVKDNLTQLNSEVNDASHSVSKMFDEVLSAGPKKTTTEETNEQSTQNSASIENSGNSLDLGSFLGDRWKKLSKSLQN